MSVVPHPSTGEEQLIHLLADLDFGPVPLIDRSLTAGILERHQAVGIIPPPGELLAGSRRSLRHYCQFGRPCWNTLCQETERYPGGVSLPWVGVRYREHGLCTVALNLRNEGQLLDEVKIVKEVADGFRSGRKKVHETTFRYRVMSAVALVRSALRGVPLPSATPDPDRLVEEFQFQALLQLVKCSPERAPTDRPTPQMIENCPSAHSLDELEILNPRVLIMFGDAVQAQIARRFQGNWESYGSPLSYGTAQIMGRRALGVCLPHPAAHGQGCLAALTALRDDLQKGSPDELCA